MPFRVTVQHPEGAAANLVDILNLPGRVVQVRDRGGLQENIVMVGGAAQERGNAGNDVADDLEAEPFGEEAVAAFLVGGAEHHVTELARRYRAGELDASGAGVQQHIAAPMSRLPRSRILPSGAKRRRTRPRTPGPGASSGRHARSARPSLAGRH
jgi:hypothetical protein